MSITASYEAKQTTCESNTVLTEIKSALHQRTKLAHCEAKKAPCEPKTTSAKAIWIKKSNPASCEVRDKSLGLASYKAKTVSDCETISALHRVQPRFSREAKVKALMSANSEAITTSLEVRALRCLQWQS